MRTISERHPGLQILTFFGGLLLGPLASLQLSRSLTPGSAIVETSSIFGFAAVFIGGTLWWMGFGLLTVVLGGLWRLLRGRAPGPEGLSPQTRLVPPGYRAFPVLGVLFGALVGLVAGLSTELTILAGIAAWGAAGLGYGTLLWIAAHHGYLPFPEPE